MTQSSDAARIYPGEVFADTAEFDAGIRQLLPHYDEMLDCLMRCLPPTATRILELGCGTGEVSLRIVQRCPNAQLVAVDYSPRMLRFAQAKLEAAGYGNRVRWLEADFGDWALGQMEPEALRSPFDACVSSLAIHHLSNELKLKLFLQIRQHLIAGGSFWNADPVLPESPVMAELYQAVREDWTAQQGSRLADVQAKIGNSAPHGHSSHDHLATLDTHLHLLQQAGFASVAAPWKYYGMAVVGGMVA